MSNSHCKHSLNKDTFCIQCELLAAEGTRVEEEDSCPDHLCLWCWENGQEALTESDDGLLCLKCAEQRELDRRCSLQDKDWEG